VVPLPTLRTKVGRPFLFRTRAEIECAAAYKHVLALCLGSRHPEPVCILPPLQWKAACLPRTLVLSRVSVSVLLDKVGMERVSRTRVPQHSET
jgi:hypothetical protein